MLSATILLETGASIYALSRAAGIPKGRLMVLVLGTKHFCCLNQTLSSNERQISEQANFAGLLKITETRQSHAAGLGSLSVVH